MNFGYEVETLFSFYQLYQWRAKILKANSASEIGIDRGPQLGALVYTNSVYNRNHVAILI